MDTGASIFQGTNIDVHKSRTEEEEEDLEDQKRRNEELQNLLMTKLDDFNYDESTVNSSIISAISIDDAQNKYLKADNEHEQLKVLYEVRGRELQTLREEYKNIMEKTTKQMDSIKRKLMLTEAEFEQLKVSYKNSDELLIEKTQVVNELSEVLDSKEKQIEEYVKNIENLQLEVATYKSTLDDMHLKIKGDRNPFGNSNKLFNSEEMRSAHKDQINKLENLLEEKTGQVKFIEKENSSLKDQLNKLLDANTDNSKLIKTLTKNFEGAQRQCEELIEVIEVLSNENKHLHDRVNTVYDNSPNKRNSLDYNSLASHVDKLKKMLVDKSVQINTLNAKLKNYEENLKELLEYRKLKADAYQKEFQQCENEDHTKNLILMQNDLQNYRRIIEDKNQQILNLNTTNRDLLAKMEETLSQTRNDIQKFSTKYSLPQLEQMAEDLKIAQNQILQLEEKLKISEQRRLSLTQQDTNKEQALKEEIEALKLLTEKEKNNFTNEIKKLQKELGLTSAEIQNLKQYTEELINKNTKLQTEVKNSENEFESLKKQYLESIKSFQETQKKMNHLQESLEEITKIKSIAEEERHALEREANHAKKKLENNQKSLSKLQIEFNNATKDLQGKDEIIHQLQVTISNLRETKLESKQPESEKKTRRNLESELNAVEEAERNQEANLITLELKLREELQKEYFDNLNEIENKYKKACSSSKDLCKEQEHKLKNQESKFREFTATILSECKERINELENDKEDLIKNVNILENQFEKFKVHANGREEQFRKLIHEIQIKNSKEAEKWKLWSQKLINSCLIIEATNKRSRDNILYKMERYDANVAAIEKKYEKVKKKINK